MSYNASVLLVDDERKALDVMSMNIKGEFKNIYTAQDGMGALDVIRHNQVDVVVSDIIMPGMTGIDFLNEVKEKYPDIVSIVITAFGSKDNVLQALRGGAHEFIEKPIRRDVLIKKIKEALKFKRLEEVEKELAVRLQTEKLSRELNSKDYEYNAAISEAKNIKNEIRVNIERRVKPILNMMQSSPLYKESKHLFELLEKELDGITEPFFTKLNEINSGLNTLESRICWYLINGYSPQSISEVFKIPAKDMNGFIKTIREKLEIEGREMSIKEYLKDMGL